MYIGFDSRNISEMIACWSDLMRNQMFQKFLDNSGICPFHWIHKGCSRYLWDMPRDEMTPYLLMNRMGAGLIGAS